MIITINVHFNVRERSGEWRFAKSKAEADLDDGQNLWHYASHTLETELKP